MKNKIISILFCLLLLSGSILHILLPDRYYSETEKRKLTQFPKISFDLIRSGKYGTLLEKYLADQFPERDKWVTVNTLLNRSLGKKESGGVYFGKDQYLVEIHKSLDVKQMQANISAVKRLSDTLKAAGVGLKVLLVPTASDILKEKLPAFAPNADQKTVIEYAKTQGADVVDAYDVLTEHSNEYIFYRTDHHWTSLGAYYAYTVWMQANGRDPLPPDRWTREVLSSNFRGTTYSKVNYPFAAYDTIEAYYRFPSHKVDYNSGNYVTDTIYERKYLKGTDQYAVFFNSNQATTVVSGAGTGKLLIIKDSYANTFAQFVIDDYAETHIIDPRFYTGSLSGYVTSNGITEVLVLYNIPNFCEDKAVERVR